MNTDTLCLGIDVGGTKSAVVVGNENGQVFEREEWSSEAQLGPGFFLGELWKRAGNLMRKYPQIKACGVSIGGPLDARKGVIYNPPNLPGWDAIPLKDLVEERLKIPVQVAHDAAACAYAEYLWGTGRGAENLAYLTCGTGFGAGFVFRGRIHTGANGASCEVGHISLRTEGPVSFGKIGTAEAYCSGTGLTLLAAWRFPVRWESSPPSGKELAGLAAQGDDDAREILRLSAAAVGDVSAILADTLGLDVILIGSLARYLGPEWMKAVRRTFDARVLPAVGLSCRLEAAGLGDRLQDCSAIAAALAKD
jgi:glucokinase